MKKTEQLDYIIKDKLNQLQVEYNPKHWEQFEQMLDAREAGTPVAESQLLDEVVFEKLHNVKAGERAAHWGRLAARLDEQVDVRRKLLFYKMMEATLLLLLLLIVSQNYPLVPVESTSPENPVVLQQNNDAAAPKINADISNNPPTASQNTSDQKQTNSSSNDLQSSSNRGHNRLTSSALNQNKENIKTTDAGVIPNKYQSLSPYLPKSPLQAPASKTDPDALDLNAASTDLQSIIPPRLELLNALEQIMIAELEYDGEPGYVAMISPVKRRSAWVVSMFGSGDYNQVITPHSVELEGDRVYERLSRYTPGYGGGFNVGLDMGRWEIGGGAVYTAKKYEPRPVLYLGGSFYDNAYDGEGLKNIELNMVQIPLYFRYNFIYHNKWRAYATMGLSLHVNLQTNYYFADDRSFALPKPLPKPNQEYKPAKRELPGGWFDGGTLWQNGYVSGNLGIGLERYIGGHWSIFAQPTYHRSLNYFTQGIGPDKDRINTMSIFTGVRVRLNN